MVANIFMPTRRTFFGWHVVGAAFIVAVFAWGIGFYGPPIFLQTLHATRGWSVTTISFAITVYFLVGAAITAWLAALHERFGVATITRVGALFTAAGLLGWAFTTSPWQLLIVAWVSGAGWAMTSGAAINAMIAPWFIRRRPAALSMAFNGASVGGVVFSPLWVALIDGFGLRIAAGIVAAAMVAALWLIAGRYLAATPAECGLLPDGDFRAARPPGNPGSTNHPPPLTRPWRDGRFVTLCAASAFGLFAQVGLIAQLFSTLVPPLGEAGAGLAMSLMTGCAVLGRLVLGVAMGPGTNRRFVATANALLQACGSVSLLLAGGHIIPLLLLGCILFGLGLGNVVSLPPLIAQADFASQDVLRVVALVIAISQACFALAPAAFGALRAIPLPPALGFGAGTSALFFVAGVVQLAAAAAFIAGRRRAAAPSAAAAS